MLCPQRDAEVERAWLRRDQPYKQHLVGRGTQHLTRRVGTRYGHDPTRQVQFAAVPGYLATRWPVLDEQVAERLERLAVGSLEAS